jgi:hypothetical protein
MASLVSSPFFVRRPFFGRLGTFPAWEGVPSTQETKIMAQPARISPLPGTGDDSQDPSEWIHDLTPTLSDEAMFDQEGHIQPLQVWPTEPVADKPASPSLRLLRKDKKEADANS